MACLDCKSHPELASPPSKDSNQGFELLVGPELVQFEQKQLIESKCASCLISTCRAQIVTPCLRWSPPASTAWSYARRILQSWCERGAQPKRSASGSLFQPILPGSAQLGSRPALHRYGRVSAPHASALLAATAGSWAAAHDSTSHSLGALPGSLAVQIAVIEFELGPADSPRGSPRVSQRTHTPSGHHSWVREPTVALPWLPHGLC